MYGLKKTVFINFINIIENNINVYGPFDIRPCIIETKPL